MILAQLLLGMAAIAASVAVHAAFMVAAEKLGPRVLPMLREALARAAAMAAVVLWFFLSISVICWGWAGLLLWRGAFEALEPALYFAIVTFTTLGYGDIVLGPEWRLLGAVMAANGTIIIGWTTALVFVAVQRIHGTGGDAGAP